MLFNLKTKSSKNLPRNKEYNLHKIELNLVFPTKRQREKLSTRNSGGLWEVIGKDQSAHKLKYHLKRRKHRLFQTSGKCDGHFRSHRESKAEGNRRNENETVFKLIFQQHSKKLKRKHTFSVPIPGIRRNHQTSGGNKKITRANWTEKPINQSTETR